ncbi:LPXTG cell wall anchor domain-containing protein [Phycicoccus sp. HDW14]|uniref:LPXTG cell wall anchor domain-containing protein n=1 Tax=Phycicoccus sp. HDW14 TaxID=2714941 RepID=UPI00140D8B93|nr:LPXTG cell wall anchor domain-containing protein [Phycicoccus sp. HDW14]QIM21267.1 LPXTG cell wall anchor domain-containing protein [Phycicoccus sp. HDW14]
MSPTTLRPGARALGALLTAVVLVGAPTAARADDATPTPTASDSPSASATPSATEPTATPSPTDTPSAEPSPSATATPSPSSSASSPASPRPSRPGGLVPGGDSARFGVRAAAGPATSTDPVLVGADYLERELVSTNYTLPIVFSGVEYPQYGVVADFVLALDAAGSGQDAATAATRTLSQHVVDYVGFGDPAEIAAGPVAKLLNVAVAQGVDPTAFGGTDLVATLRGLEKPSGRFSDVSQYGDNSNVFGQSLALIGLTRAGVTVSTQARAYLVAQQCPGGGFQISMSDAGCTSDTDADADATAMAVQALLAVGGQQAAVTAGLDQLASIQRPTGGVGGAVGSSSGNANTTGLAGQAFLAGGRTAQARSAASYLVALQYGCSFPAAVRGGIAYDQAAYDAKVADGSTAVPTDPDRRSSSQALLALAGVPLGSVTATGADAEAPSLTCATATPTTTPTATTEPTSDPTTTAGAGGSPSSTPVAAAPAGALAQTGTDPLLPVLVGLALLLVGGLAVVASRRRGAHA